MNEPTEPPDPLKYSALFTIMPVPAPGHWQLKTTTFSPAADAFSNNTERVHSLMRHTPVLIDAAMMWQHVAASANLAACGRSAITSEEFAAEPDLRGRSQSEFLKAAQSLAEKVRSDPDAEIKALSRGVATLGNLLEMNPDSHLWSSVQATFASLIIHAWTAIEVLAGDLWEAAINIRPRRLAVLDGSAKRISGNAGDKKGASDKGQGDGGGIKLSVSNLLKISQGSLNFSSVLGTALREAGEANFSALSGIRAAYSRAFSEHHTRVDAALGNQVIDTLATLRNCLVHKAGVADKEYTEKNYLTLLPQVTEGKPIVLDGEVVASIINPSLQCGKALIEAVDGWVDAHPEK